MGAICQGCDGCDGDTRWLKKAIGFKEDKIQGVQGVQEQEPAGANSERSNLRPFVSVGTQGLTRLSARGLIRLAFEKKASKAFKEEKREDLFQVDSAFVGSPMRRLKCRKKLAVGCDEGGYLRSLLGQLVVPLPGYFLRARCFFTLPPSSRGFGRDFQPLGLRLKGMPRGFKEDFSDFWVGISCLFV
ncbi:hypothetical protein Ae201684P_013506 [Aphanomyces euteiches]|nr:hypothetical protein Ae201684P_013506 [Aphanomyces euteiches]